MNSNLVLAETAPRYPSQGGEDIVVPHYRRFTNLSWAELIVQGAFFDVYRDLQYGGLMDIGGEHVDRECNF
jgi:hypothetical protein